MIDNTVRNIRLDLEQRNAIQAEQEEAYVKAEADMRFAAWLDGMRRQFASEARAEYLAAHPPMTFAQVATLRVRLAYGPGATDEEIQRNVSFLVAEHEATP